MTTLRGMLGDTARGLLDGKRPERRSAPLGEAELHTSYARVRASFYLASATPLLWMGMPEIVGFLGLAEAALHEAGLDEQAELVRCTAALWAEWVSDGRPRRAARPGRSRARLPPPQRGPGGYGPGMTEVTLTLNGRERQTSVPEGATLAELLREQVGLTGTKIACAEGTCGACTVLVDGRAVLSCILRAEQAEGAAVTTIEGLGDEGALSALQRAFVEEDALQCGFCTAGQVVSATALLAETPRPTSEQVRAAMSGNLCRCGAYPGIERAVLRAAEELAGAG